MNITSVSTSRWDGNEHAVLLSCVYRRTNQQKEKAVQGKLFEGEKYTYREFVTSMTGKAHKVIEEYDKRADSENLIGRPSVKDWQQ